MTDPRGEAPSKEQRLLATDTARRYFNPLSTYRGSDAVEQCRLAIVDAFAASATPANARAVAAALKVVLDDWANANEIGDDAREDAESALNAYYAATLPEAPQPAMTPERELLIRRIDNALSFGTTGRDALPTLLKDCRNALLALPVQDMSLDRALNSHHYPPLPATARRDGHAALRVRDGKMEVFDPNPKTVDAAWDAWQQRVAALPVLPPNTNEAFKAGWHAAQSETPAGGTAKVPEGWKLVPVAQLRHWHEYWNGNANERAMQDALEHILNEIESVLDAPSRSGNEERK